MEDPVSETQQTSLFLPTELLILIASFSSRKTLVNLCLTSKLWCTLAQPNLYRNHCRLHWQSSWPYMRTLVARPDLASQVTTLHHHLWQPVDDELSTELREDSYPSEWKNTQDRRISQIMSWLWAKFPCHSRDDRRFTRNKQAFTTLLTLLPNLESLDLEVAPTVTDRMEDMLKHAQILSRPNGSFLSKLSELKITRRIVRTGSSPLYDVSPLILLPSLRSVSSYGCQLDHFLLFQSSNITTLSLIDSVYSDHGIANLIGACLALKTFKLTSSSLWDPIHNVLNFRYTGHALGEELESFIFNIDGMINSDIAPTVTVALALLHI